MPDAIWLDLEHDLEKLKTQHLYRCPEIFSSRRSGQRLETFIDFSSNDYLGLSRHPEVLRAAMLSGKKWGTGSGASRLLSGNLQIHTDLEKKIASFKKEEDATIFSSGYLANIGVLSSLANEKDLILMDRLNHASLFDGARLCRARWRVYPHLDLSELEKLLSRAGSFRRRFVVTDAYFSMDGHVAALDELLSICQKYAAVLVIDEAHSTGVFGKSGRGLTEHFHLEGKVPVVMGTLSKALGSVGGFIAGKRTLKETLNNFCRPFIYTTAPPPAASAAAQMALQLVENNDALRTRLWENVKCLRGALTDAGFDLMRSEGPIVPIRTGDVAKALRMREDLKKKGFVVSAIRPPTVPKGTDRLRVSVSASHHHAQIVSLVRALKKVNGRYR